jgi:hypothetical protein
LRFFCPETDGPCYKQYRKIRPSGISKKYAQQKKDITLYFSLNYKNS